MDVLKVMNYYNWVMPNLRQHWMFLTCGVSKSYGLLQLGDALIRQHWMFLTCEVLKEMDYYN